MPKLRKENPGLRYAQLRNLLYENFKVSVLLFYEKNIFVIEKKNLQFYD